MTTHFPMRRHDIQCKAKIHYFKEIDRSDTCPQKTVQDIVIAGYRLHDSATVSSACLYLGIIVPGPAALATELLVCPSVPDLMPALQTDRSMSYCFLIFHLQRFLWQISQDFPYPATAAFMFFSFR